MNSSDLVDLGPGVQVMYVPPHAEGDKTHPHCEAGFITGQTDKLGILQCRFWSMPLSDPPEMRTTHGSEPVSTRLLIPHESVDQALVDEFMAKHYPKE